MLLYCQFYLTKFVPFELFPQRSRLSQNFCLEKRRPKTPVTCKVVGLWLHFHATIGVLLCCLQEHTIVVSLEATTLIPFLSCHKDGRKQLAIVICELSITRRWRQSYFSCCIAMSKQGWLHFLHHIAREQAKTKKLNIARCECKLQGYDDGRSPT